MNNLLFIISTGLIVFPYILYYIYILIYNKKEITKDTGFNICKELVSEYDNINIIENSYNNTHYNIKRKVVKLSKSSYYDNILSSISIALFETSISIIDKIGNKYINILRNIIYNIKLIYILPLFLIFINYITKTVGDVKINAFIVLIIIILTYIQDDIYNKSVSYLNDSIDKIKEINKNNKKLVLKYINSLYKFNKCIFIGELLIIVRMVYIYLN